MTDLVRALPARKNKSALGESLYGAPHMLQFYIMRLSSVPNRQYERDRSMLGGYLKEQRPPGPSIPERNQRL
jgi:hypothetical protein